MIDRERGLPVQSAVPRFLRENRRRMMRKILLTTVAVAAVVGVAGLASAQTTQAPSGGSAAKPESTEHQAPGAMGGALKGNINGPGAAKSAQTPAQGAKPEQRMGQDEKQTTPQRGAQEEKPATQEQRGAQEQKSGAQEQRGAQEEKSGTQEQRGAQEENSKSGAKANEQNASKTTGSRGAAVQLSQTQRTKIQAVIGHSSAARVTNVNFNVEVGVAIPRTVHVEVLPQDIVEIVPQFEGFEYIIVGDNILIIDPDTLEIVDIIPA
jgi:hypothetical protein